LATPANRISRGTGAEVEAAATKALDIEVLGAVSWATANNPVDKIARTALATRILIGPLLFCDFDHFFEL
jgi:hypothetical protein